MSEHQASFHGSHTSSSSSPGPSSPGPSPHGSFSYGPTPDGPAHAGSRRGVVRVPVVALVALVLGGAVLGGGAAAGVQQLLGEDGGSAAGAVANGVHASASDGGSVAEVARSVGPSVVEIKASSDTGQSTGSGVVISRDGEILTNNHVVANADSVRITFHDGRTATAGVVGRAPDRDMALVKARNVDGLTPAKLGDSGKVGVGAEVVAIGSPEGLSGTVTSGIVSATDRKVTVPKESGDGGSGQGSQDGQGYDGDRWPFEFGGGRYNGDPGEDTTTYEALQTDASLNPGNSGGALVTMDGRVIGINSAMYSSGSGSGVAAGGGGSVGLGFAVPIDSVKEVLGDMRSGDGGR